MTQEDIIRMAREVDINANANEPYSLSEETAAWIERFAALVAAAENEACAKVCDDEWGTGAEKDAGIVFAKAIRARGQA